MWLQVRARLLAGGAAAAHVQLGAAGGHDDAVVVRALRAVVRVRLYLDVVDVLMQATNANAPASEDCVNQFAAQ